MVEREEEKNLTREGFLSKFSWDEYVQKSQADDSGAEEFFKQVEDNDRRRLLAWEHSFSSWVRQ